MKAKKLQVFLMLLVLGIGISLFGIGEILAQEIDPYKYTVEIGTVESLQGEIFLIRENGKEISLKKNDLIKAEDIRRFTLTYSDNAITLEDGRKDIEEDIILKTGSNSEAKINLNDFQENRSFIILGPDTEIRISVKGGCIYTTEQDGEGYDRETLKWRHLTPYLVSNLKKGKARINYQPNGKLNMFPTNTENAEIRSKSRFKSNLDYEIEVLTGSEAKTEKINLESPESKVEEQIESIIQAYLMMYKVESIDELSEGVRNQLEGQLEAVKEMSMMGAKTTQKLMQESEIVTILKVYKGSLELIDTEIKEGQMAKVKGDFKQVSIPEKF